MYAYVYVYAYVYLWIQNSAVDIEFIVSSAVKTRILSRGLFLE